MKLEERLKAQMPQNALASAGMLCIYCELGPCCINPFDDEPHAGACGIDAENMNYVNLGMKVMKGLTDYKVVSGLTVSLDNMLQHHTAGITVTDLVTAAGSILKASQEKVDQWQSDQRAPREIEHGVGVLQKDAVNIVITAYSTEMVKQARSQKMRKLARDNNAAGINLVGALCGGAETAYNFGIPLLGGTQQLEEAKDMIDYVYEGGDVEKACETAVNNFTQRDPALFRHFTPKRYSTGHEIDVKALNEAVDKGLIKGVVVVMGHETQKSTWDIDALIRELVDNDFMVINLSCHLRADETPEKCALKSYNIPCVLNGGCCEPGKIVGLTKVTVLIPGWTNPRFLTIALALASQKIPVVLGTLPFVIPEVKNKLQAAGITVETTSQKVLELLR
jgi:hydroxylamine reductase (hybrid-cluster protein)